MIHFLKETVYDKVEDCLTLAETTLGREMPRPSKVLFDVRGKVAAKTKMRVILPGSIRYSLHFNPVLLRDNAHYVEETVPHEVAHAVAFHVYGHNGHGVPWKEVMQNVYGLQPDRLHTYDVRNAIIGGAEEYRCECMVHLVSRVVHRRIQNGQVRRCNQCKSRLYLNR